MKKKERVIRCDICGSLVVESYYDQHTLTTCRKSSPFRNSPFNQSKRKKSKNIRKELPKEEFIICQACSGSGGALGTCPKCNGIGYTKD